MTEFGEPRAFIRDRDLPRVLGLFVDLHAATPHPDYQHPGGIAWWLRRIVKDDFKVFIWDDGDDIAAFVIDDAGYVIPRTADNDVNSRLQLIAWAERSFRSSGRATIEVAAADDELELREALQARGYESSGSSSVELVFDIRAEPPPPVLPIGYRLVTLEDLSDDTYIDLHRAAWSTVRPSEYDRRLHDVVTSMPDFRRDMVPVVVAPDGTPAAYCIGWFDSRTHSVEIEPLGTHPAHRRLGLGRAIVRDIHHRSWVHGARSVIVWGSHGNVAATRLYRSSGMEPRRTVRDYRRVL